MVNPLDEVITVYAVPSKPDPPDTSQFSLAEPPTLVLALICMGTLAAFGLVKRARGSAKRSTGRSATKIPAPHFGKAAGVSGEAEKRVA